MQIVCECVRAFCAANSHVCAAVIVPVFVFQVFLLVKLMPFRLLHFPDTRSHTLIPFFLKI